jgi:hypothetical protein
LTMSAEFCRVQAAHQQRCAADSPLDNVRRIGALAAATWEGEALAAELGARRRQVARAATETKLRARDDLVLSENPDRGVASEPASAGSTGTSQ